MYKVIQAQTRPNTNVPFHKADESEAISATCKQYFFENYILTGKNIDHSHAYSDDGLSCETTTIWESEEAYLQFRNDPNIVEIINDRHSHCDAHSIIRSVSGSQV
jgi:hypothetical protein